MGRPLRNFGYLPVLFPLLNEIENLCCQLGVILIGTAPALFHQRQQPLCSVHKVSVHRIGTLAASQRQCSLDWLRLRVDYHFIRKQIIDRTAIRRFCTVTPFSQQCLKFLNRIVIPVIDIHRFGFLPESL